MSKKCNISYSTTGNKVEAYINHPTDPDRKIPVSNIEFYKEQFEIRNSELLENQKSQKAKDKLIVGHIAAQISTSVVAEHSKWENAVYDKLHNSEYPSKLEAYFNAINNDEPKDDIEKAMFEVLAITGSAAVKEALPSFIDPITLQPMPARVSNTGKITFYSDSIPEEYLGYGNMFPSIEKYNEGDAFLIHSPHEVLGKIKKKRMSDARMEQIHNAYVNYKPELKLPSKNNTKTFDSVASYWSTLSAQGNLNAGQGVIDQIGNTAKKFRSKNKKAAGNSTKATTVTKASQVENIDRFGAPKNKTENTFKDKFNVIKGQVVHKQLETIMELVDGIHKLKYTINDTSVTDPESYFRENKDDDEFTDRGKTLLKKLGFSVVKNSEGKEILEGDESGNQFDKLMEMLSAIHRITKAESPKDGEKTNSKMRIASELESLKNLIYPFLRNRAIEHYIGINNIEYVNSEDGVFSENINMIQGANASNEQFDFDEVKDNLDRFFGITTQMVENRRSRLRGGKFSAVADMLQMQSGLHSYIHELGKEHGGVTKIYNEFDMFSVEQNAKGQMDVFVVFNDGSVAIYDYKTFYNGALESNYITSKKDKNATILLEDAATDSKIASYASSMARYRQMALEYGATRVVESRLIPIPIVLNWKIEDGEYLLNDEAVLDYGFRPVQQQNRATRFIPVGESTGVETLDQILKDLEEKAESLRFKRKRAYGNQKLVEEIEAQLNDLNDQIYELLVNKSIVGMTRRLAQIKEIVYNKDMYNQFTSTEAWELLKELESMSYISNITRAKSYFSSKTQKEAMELSVALAGAIADIQGLQSEILSKADTGILSAFGISISAIETELSTMEANLMPFAELSASSVRVLKLAMQQRQDIADARFDQHLRDIEKMKNIFSSDEEVNAAVRAIFDKKKGKLISRFSDNFLAFLEKPSIDPAAYMHIHEFVGDVDAYVAETAAKKIELQMDDKALTKFMKSRLIDENGKKINPNAWIKGAAKEYIQITEDDSVIQKKTRHLMEDGAIGSQFSALSSKQKQFYKMYYMKVQDLLRQMGINRELNFIPAVQQQILEQAFRGNTAGIKQYLTKDIWIEVLADTDEANEVEKAIPVKYIANALSKEEIKELEQEIIDAQKELETEEDPVQIAILNNTIESNRKTLNRSIGAETISDNLLNSLIMFARASEDTIALQELEKGALILEMQTRRKSYFKRTKAGRIAERYGSPEIVSASESTAEAGAYQKYRDRMIYGRNITDSEMMFELPEHEWMPEAVRGQNVSVNKVIKVLHSYLSLNALSFNFTSAVAGGFQAGVSFWITGHKGKYYTSKHWNKAARSALANYKDFIGLWMVLGPDKNGLMDKARIKNANSVWEYVNAADMAMVQQLFAESSAEIVMVRAMLDGTYLDNKGRMKSHRKVPKGEGISLWDMINKTPDGKVDFKKDPNLFSDWFKANGKSLEEAAELTGKFKRRINAVINRNKGNMSPEYTNAFSTMLAGQILTKFRGWIWGMARERFQGTEYIEELDEWETGRYRGFLTHLAKQLHEKQDSIVTASLKMAGDIMLGWTKMYDSGYGKQGALDKSKAAMADHFIELLEKTQPNHPVLKAIEKGEMTKEEAADDLANAYIDQYRAMVVELRVALVVFMLWGAAAGLKGDEDDREKMPYMQKLAIDKAAAIMRRFSLESTFFLNPASATELMRSPFALFGVVEKMTSLVGNSFDETRDVIMGEDSKNDTTPAFHYFFKSAPVINQGYGLTYEMMKLSDMDMSPEQGIHIPQGPFIDYSK